MSGTFLHWLSNATDRTYEIVSFTFNTSLGIPAALLLTLVAAAAVWYWRVHLVALQPRHRRLLIALRAAALVLLLLLLFDPVLLARRLEPGEQFVLVLFDDSRSMQVVGTDGQTRGQRLLEAYADSRFEERLRQSHQVALFRFGEHLERLRHPSELRFSRRATDLVGAVESVLRKMAGITVSAVVLFSDGIQQTQQPTLDAAALSSQVPVFTVGTDADTTWRALALTDLSVARPPFDRSPVALTARIHATGLAGEEALFEVVENDRTVASSAFVIADDADDRSVRLEFAPRRRGWLHYTARVRLSRETEERLSADPVSADNARDFLIDNRARTYRILYFGGRPGWEHKFLRRALESDPQLNLSSLIRVSGAERQFVFQGGSSSLANPLFEGFYDDDAGGPRYDEAVFLRLGLRESELASGYPLEAGELFPFHLLIWGAVERGFFSPGQLQLTRQFVSRRGGSFLVTGGPHSLAEGGYARTPIEAVLPFVLGRAEEENSGIYLPFYPRPTIEGWLSGVWLLGADPLQNAARWTALPALYGLNRLTATRAGATVLARTASPSASIDDRPLFARQRYGEGTGAVLATGATWPWRMLSAADDDSHERFWRRLMRDLLRDVPAPVLLTAGAEDLHVDDQRRLEFLVRDSLFVRREGLGMRIELTAPDGTVRHLPVEESIEETGLYAAEFSPHQPGMHLLKLTAQDLADTPVAALEQAVLVHPDDRELRHFHYDPTFLREIAARTGGRFFSLGELDRLPPQLPRIHSQRQRQDRFHLWHLPIFYLVLALLFTGEWYLRRKQGQP
jgi:hypothetical protein